MKTSYMKEIKNFEKKDRKLRRANKREREYMALIRKSKAFEMARNSEN